MSAGKSFVEDYGRNVADEFAGLFVGPELGRGVFRVVHAHALERRHVLKFEAGTNQSFCNVREWTLWETVAYNPQFREIRKWLAPCVAISESGNVLVQMRTVPIPKRMFPRRLPAFFSDLQIANWGLLNGRPVCHDYASHLGLERGLTDKLKRVEWPEWTP